MAGAAHVVDSIGGPSPALWCQAFFLGFAGLTLALHILPAGLRSIIMDYGPRRLGRGSDSGSVPKAVDGSRTGTRAVGEERGLVALLTRGEVPHSWFWHFYALAVSSSAFWAWQYVRKGSIMAALAQAQLRSGPSIELGYVFLAWSMVVVQELRRLYECFFVFKQGQTPMGLAHWAIGLGFYTGVNIAVWIHGSDAILESWASYQPAVLLTPRVPLALTIFVAAWLKQNQCHRHLASLKKYTLPGEGLFRYIICPHYTCECVIYLAMALMTAPPGSLFNVTFLCVVAATAVNLGVTARGTKQWYARKFGAEQVAGRWMMIPFVF